MNSDWLMLIPLYTVGCCSQSVKSVKWNWLIISKVISSRCLSTIVYSRLLRPILKETPEENRLHSDTLGGGIHLKRWPAVIKLKKKTRRRQQQQKKRRTRSRSRGRSSRGDGVFEFWPQTSTETFFTSAELVSSTSTEPNLFSVTRWVYRPVPVHRTGASIYCRPAAQLTG